MLKWHDISSACSWFLGKHLLGDALELLGGQQLSEFSLFVHFIRCKLGNCLSSLVPFK